MEKKSFDLTQSLRLFLTGVGMGAADLVPGVSGGTIAFIFGVYQQLIDSIKTLSGETLQLFFKGKFVDAFKSIPFAFLIPLAIGDLGAILALSHVVAYLLTDYPVYVWSFFFGLVIASTVIVAKRVEKWDAKAIGACVISTIITFFIVGAVPVETPNNPIWIFASGAIAIVAMILPGISGSFILVILGKYAQILGAVNERAIGTLLIFMAGCAVGIALFSRVLSWLFKHHHNITIAILTGFLIGSLRKIWPWKETVLTRVNSHGEIVPLVEKNIMPHLTPELIGAVLLLALGIGLMVFFQRFEVTKEHDESGKVVA